MKILQYLVLGIFALLLTRCDTLSQLPMSTTTSPSTGSSSVSKSEISSGLKQALSKGLEQSVKTLSAKDGFLGNQAVKILMPPEALKAEKTLRSIGLGSLCDKLIQSLNHAAESAVSEAAPVFVSSLKQLTIADATNILLSGKQDAATDFFKRTTTAQLSEKFRPIIDQHLNRYQVSTYWNEFTTRYNQVPLVKDKVETDLNKYVTQKAIEGLFYEVAQEERKIRSNLGGSRSTPLLQKVFGYADKH